MSRKRARSATRTAAAAGGEVETQLLQDSEASMGEDGGFAVPATPARGGAHVAVRQVVDTPTRTTRLEEKSEFQKLNKRLEYVFLVQREKEGSAHGLKGELEALRTKSVSDVAELRTLYDSQLSASVRARENLGADVSRLSEENGRMARELAQLKSKLDGEQKQRAALESLSAQRADDQEEAQQRALKAEDLAAQLEHQLSIQKQANEHLAASLEDARKAATSSASTLITEQSEAKVVIEKNQVKLSNVEQELALVKEELHQIERERASDEDRLRLDFGQQLRDLLEERQRAHEQDKEELNADLRRTFNARLEEYVEDLEACKHELADEQQKKAALLGELAKVKTDAADARAARDSLRLEVDALRGELAAFSEKHNGVVEEKEARLDNLRELLRRKDEEFNALMDVKITLAMEIKAYRALLDKEESRLGYLSPAPSPGAAAAAAAAAAGGSSSGSRKSVTTASAFGYSSTSSTSSSSTSSAAASAGGRSDQTNQLMITSVDSGLVRLKNGSTESVSLDGWTIRTRKRRLRFDFPAGLVLQPGAVISVHIGKDAKKRLRSSSDVAWSTDDVFHVKGDIATLVDGRDNEVSRVDYIAH